MEPKLIAMCVGAVLLVGGAGGCGDDNEGTLQQNWTIQGTTTPNACTLARATQMRLVVVDANGFSEATSFVPCASFSSTLTLAENNYTGAATFLGEDGLAVSQTKIIPAFRISGGLTTTQTIDFAIGDFIAR